MFHFCGLEILFLLYGWMVVDHLRRSHWRYWYHRRAHSPRVTERCRARILAEED